MKSKNKYKLLFKRLTFFSVFISTLLLIFSVCSIKLVSASQRADAVNSRFAIPFDSVVMINNIGGGYYEQHPFRTTFYYDLVDNGATPSITEYYSSLEYRAYQFSEIIVGESFDYGYITWQIGANNNYGTLVSMSAYGFLLDYNMPNYRYYICNKYNSDIGISITMEYLKSNGELGVASADYVLYSRPNADFTELDSTNSTDISDIFAIPLSAGDIYYVNYLTIEFYDFPSSSGYLGFYCPFYTIEQYNEFATRYRDQLVETVVYTPNVFGSIASSVNNVLSIEILPNFSFFDLLIVVVTIPLTIALLKLWLGG